MNPAECLFFGVGALFLLSFLANTAGPFFRAWFVNTAGKRSNDLREDFLLLSPGVIAKSLLAAGGIFAAIGMIATGDVIRALAAGLAPMLLSGIAVRYFRIRRRKKVVSQLPAFLDVLAGYVKAGHSLSEAISETMPLLPGGIREEIAWLFHMSRLGTPLPEAFLLWEKRLPCEEVSLVVRPLRVAIPNGGNLADLLERTRDILRGQARMREKMNSLTAQARLQAVVLTLLPPVFTFAMTHVDPDFFLRSTGTPTGRYILMASGILQFAGWLSIRKILAVKP